jgi:His/Glu/Gln/Arg/opine family amino acid ABC transporter permease subunit
VNWQGVGASLGYLLRGTGSTVELAATVLATGTALGLGLGLLRVVPVPPLQRAVAAVIEFVRAVPLLLQVFFIFFGLPAFGVEMPVFLSAVLAITLWMGVNGAEVVRGAIQSIPQGQAEAAYSTGLGYWQAMRWVVFPQALRRMLPPFVGLCTILIKDTSLAAIIGVFELTRAAQETIERTFRSFEIYLLASAIYFCLSYPLSLLAQRAEARLQRS